MPAAKSVWAIDIGNNSLKALRLRQSDEKIEVIGLDYIEHTQSIFTETSEEEKNQIIRESLHIFAERNELGKDLIAISVPGQTSFARFIKLPPVEEKRVPEIVKFEAVQQIPFDINEVEWDWQLMPKLDSPDTEVGIFAIKNELVSKYLENFSAENIRISIVQMAPIALYNYAWFDRTDLDEADKNAVILLDMGADNTNLVVCTKTSVWQRCIPLGGNKFTRIIAEAFKLNFEKAEKLKRGAPVSKYARQIFHAMKPVFTDFGTEVQRSLGYYSSSHKDTTFSKIVLFGGGLRLQGLNKYIQQTTQIPAARPDAFEKLIPAQSISSAKLHENISDFAIAYGLGLQALKTAKIQSNLLPKKIARSMLWAQKSKYFIIAAAILLVVSLLALLKTNIDLKTCSSQEYMSIESNVKSILQKAKKIKSDFSSQNTRSNESQNKIDEQFKLFEYRNIIPLLHETILKTLPNKENNPSQAELYDAYSKGDIAKIKQFPRNERKQVFITSFGVKYTDDLAETSLDVDRPKNFVKSSSTISYQSSNQDRRISTETASKDVQKNAKGFVVVIEGFSPYSRIGELMDPAGVGENRQQWGVVTRMLNLDKVIDANCPFEIFQKNDIKHFKLETGHVDLEDRQMPEGIGIRQLKIRVADEELDENAAIAATGRKSSRDISLGLKSSSSADIVKSELVLVDPQTNEEISKTANINKEGRKQYDSFGKPLYIERDMWFILRVKFIWKDTL
ncbi:MAG: type IV pilus assembly protein PilM [Sedimentisphaerales bacterium]|nr:type IV pilus assembly protein PilM [Sedimentisphaerales bacterium]